MATSVDRKLKIVRTREELRDALGSPPRPVGLVPTMGWLHEGHRSLMRPARANNATTVVSIFVNPRQFNSPDDLAQYRRDEPQYRAMRGEEAGRLLCRSS